MDILCIDNNFSPEQMAIIPNRPEKGKMYTIRDIVRSTLGTGLLLNEITNPHNGWTEIDGMKFTFEPNFNIRRFSNLNGEVLTYEMIRKEVGAKV